jgi:hypothetical protein
MKVFLTILLVIFGLNSFGQMIIYSCGKILPCDTSDHFTIDTIKISGDTTYILAKHFIGGHFLHQEEQLWIKNNSNESIFPNGHSIQWYASGQKKCEGTFKMGQKLKDWKYWNADGKEIPEPNYNSEIKVRGKKSNFVDGKKQ